MEIHTIPLLQGFRLSFPGLCDWLVSRHGHALVGAVGHGVNVKQQHGTG